MYIESFNNNNNILKPDMTQREFENLKPTNNCCQSNLMSVVLLSWLCFARQLPIEEESLEYRNTCNNQQYYICDGIN